MSVRMSLVCVGLAFSGGLLLAAPAAAADTGGFVFGGLDGSQGGYFAFVGGGVAPGGADESGFVLRGFVGHGEYEYDVGGPADAEGQVTTVDVMVGFQVVSEKSRVSAYVGPNYQDHQVDNDPLNPVQGDEWGVKGQVEYYGQPTSNTMLQAIGSFSTANETYFALVKAGWKVVGDTYLGPEAAFSGNERYDQWRAGVHATGFGLGPAGLNFSAGYVDSDDGSGVYGQVGFTVRF